jgi:hypothetical protein
LNYLNSNIPCQKEKNQIYKMIKSSNSFQILTQNGKAGHDMIIDGIRFVYRPKKRF